MKAALLHKLSLCSELTKLDGVDAAFTMEAGGGELRASYRGSYCAGSIVVSGWEGADFCTTVVGSQFRAIAGLFGAGDEISLKPTATTMQIGNASQGATLRVERGGEPWDFVTADVPIFTIQHDRDALIQEFEYADLFSGKKGVMPVLTGIRVSVNKGAVSFTSSDGVGIVYVAQFKPAQVDGSGAIVLAGGDILTGLRLMDAGTVVIRFFAEHERLVIDDMVNMFYTVGLGGEWPDFAKALGKPDELQSVEISGQALQAVANAGAALNSGPDIEILARGDSLIIRTPNGPDMGAFALKQDGQVGQFTGSRLYDGATLALMTKLANSFEFRIPANDRAPTIVKNEQRTMFLIPKYQRTEG